MSFLHHEVAITLVTFLAEDEFTKTTERHKYFRGRHKENQFSNEELVGFIYPSTKNIHPYSTT